MEIKKLYDLSKMRRHLKEFIGEYYVNDLENYMFDVYIKEEHFYDNIDNLVMCFRDTDLFDILNKLYHNDVDMLKNIDELNNLYKEFGRFECIGEEDEHIDFIGLENFIMRKIILEDIFKIARVDFEIIRNKILCKNKDVVLQFNGD